jgi:hypothetical protein
MKRKLIKHKPNDFGKGIIFPIIKRTNGKFLSDYIIGIEGWRELVRSAAMKS